MPASLSTLRSYVSTIFLFIAFLPTAVYALTPIARWDVVPHQRFTGTEAFNIGVIAFSKAGIDRVEFTVAGQGYSGRNPLLSTAMTYNARTNVYEYWVPLSAADFSSNGPVTVSAIVHGKDGGKRNIGSVPLIVDANGTLIQPKAWVSVTGSDVTGDVNIRSKPFATIRAAIGAIHAMNGGKADGSIVYLEEGAYNLSGDGTVPVTSNEWVTIKNAEGAAAEHTIISDGGGLAGTHLMKVDGVTLTSNGAFDFVFDPSRPDKLWVHNARLIGANRHVGGSNPVKNNGDVYFTDTYIYNVDRAVHGGKLVRGLTIERIGEDAFQGTLLAVNIRVNDMNPGSTYWHADAYQSDIGGMENRIVYNYYGTDLHYQGLFLRARDFRPANNAFVNVFMEMRQPGYPGSAGGKKIQSNGSMHGPWDHVLVWHSTFPTARFYFADDMSGYGLTNASFIGNVFYELTDAESSVGSEIPWTRPGNNKNNEFLHNHYIQSYVDLPSGHSCGWPTPPGCPHAHSRSPDSDQNGSQSVGDPQLRLPGLSMGDPTPSTFGQPEDGSPLIDRLTHVLIPADAFGNPRDQMPDIGAVENVTGGVGMPANACFDSVDNDSDGLTDYPDDPGCASTIDNDEYNAPASALAVVASAADGGNLPENTVDGNLDTRWSAEGDGQWIRYDLGEQKQLSVIKIAWHQGDSRIATFDVQISSDEANWTTVLDRTTSNGATLDLETHQLGNQSARYVRILCHMNTANAWNSITEVIIVESQLTAPANLRIQ